jgi:hypothetical protein
MDMCREKKSEYKKNATEHGEFDLNASDDVMRVTTLWKGMIPHKDAKDIRNFTGGSRDCGDRPFQHSARAGDTVPEDDGPRQ